MLAIENYRQDIARICLDLRVKRLELVGSAAREDFQPESSDIDVLVEFDGDDKLFERYFSLKSQLEKLFGRHVDVIQEKAVKNPFVKNSLHRNRISVYGS
ncbi:MAG: nucleotidyltransferase domain-containing protein [bacterium]